MIAQRLQANATMLGMFLPILCQAPAEAAAPAESTVASRDVIYFHTSYPVFLRFHIQIDGARFDASWLKYLESVFGQIDADHDRRLTPRETQARKDKLPSECRAILGMRNLWMADQDPFDRAITLSELARFLTENGRGPFQSSTDRMSAPRTGNLGDTLFDLLDTDENGQLSSAEFSHGARAMHRRDLDDDGTFSAAELMPGRRVLFVSPTGMGAETTPAKFTALVPGTSPAAVLDELVERYAKRTHPAPAGSDLNAADLGLDDNEFKRFDIDSNRSLDHDELRRLIKNPPPTLELLIRIHSKDKASHFVTTIRSSKDSVSVRTGRRLASIVLDHVQIEIGREASSVEGVRSFLAQQFDATDQDNNKYLDSSEAQRSQVFDLSFNEFDINGDGKIYEEELTVSIDSKAEVAATRTCMTIWNRGRDLFQILDSNRDRRLSARELDEAAGRIELWDSNSDGMIDSDEVPQIFQLVLGPGQPEFPGVQLPTPSILGSQVEVQRGPHWFHKMDRNSDGELSRREFPGPRSQFRKLDLNSDGVVDPREAEEAGSE